MKKQGDAPGEGLGGSDECTKRRLRVYEHVPFRKSFRQLVMVYIVVVGAVKDSCDSSRVP